MTYKEKPDHRDTSNGITPSKSTVRPVPHPTVKPIAGNYLKSMKPLRLNPGKRG